MVKRHLIPLLSATLVLAACSAAPQNSPAPATGGNKELHVSRAEDFTSIAELTRASTAVIKGTAGTATVETVNGVPFTVTQIKVDEVLSGMLTAAEIPLKQIGSTQVGSRDTSSLLTEGGQYLIFLRPFYWTPGDNTGQYTITGDRGLYELDAKAQQYSFRGGVDSPLPGALTTESVNARRF